MLPFLEQVHYDVVLVHSAMVCDTMLHSVKESVSWTDMLGLNGKSKMDSPDSPSSLTLATTSNATSPVKAPPTVTVRSNDRENDKQQFKELISYFERNDVKTALASAYKQLKKYWRG
jgi:hypothetical protein